MNATPEPGFYILGANVTNPKPDRRYGSGRTGLHNDAWEHWVTLPRGFRLYVVARHHKRDGEPTLTIENARGRFHEAISVYSNPELWALVTANLIPVEEDLTDLLHRRMRDNAAHEILERLIHRGTITLAQVEAELDASDAEDEAFTETRAQGER
jgi:hypothetical protein